MTNAERLLRLFRDKDLTHPLFIADVVNELTAHRTASINEMTEAEVLTVIKGLETGAIDLQAEYAAIQELKEAKRAEIIAIAARTGFFPVSDANFDFFENWVKKSGPFEKSFWMHSNCELDALYLKFTHIERLFEEKAAEVGSPAWKIKQARAQLTRND